MRPPKEFSGSQLALYLAAPLFNPSERDLNSHLANILAEWFKVYLPQRDGGVMAEMLKQGVLPRDAARKVFSEDIAAVYSCDVLVAVLDGRTIDEGVAFEVGFAFACGKACYGLQADVRRMLPTGNNPMIQESLKSTFASIVELAAWARSYDTSVSHAKSDVQQVVDAYVRDPDL